MSSRSGLQNKMEAFEVAVLLKGFQLTDEKKERHTQFF